MGDYTKLVVHCEVKVDKALLEKKVEELRLGVSAYHCDGLVVVIEDPSSTFPSAGIQLSLIGQTKYGARQQEFLDWLRPFVIQGSGPTDIWAFQMDEYFDEPTILRLRDKGDG